MRTEPVHDLGTSPLQALETRVRQLDQKSPKNARDYAMLRTEQARLIRHYRTALAVANGEIGDLRERLDAYECPAGGPHYWTTHEEPGTGRTGMACDECHRPAPKDPT